MQYEQAISTVTSAEAITNVLLFLIAAAVLFILACQVVKMWREIFSKPKDDEASKYKKHCRESDERFQEGEQRIAENTKRIDDLREGQRVMCIACMALLNHALHDGNTGEMNKALADLNSYLLSK